MLNTSNVDILALNAPIHFQKKTPAEIFRLLHEGLNYTTIARACHVSITIVIVRLQHLQKSQDKEIGEFVDKTKYGNQD